jgi:hypothetical protein
MRIAIAIVLGIVVAACGSSGSSGSGSDASAGDDAAGHDAAGHDSPSGDASAQCPQTQPQGSTPGSRGPGGTGPFKDKCQAYDGANCSYGATCCACEPTASCGGDVLWWCSTTNAPAPCPSSLPANDDACSGNTTRSCTYCVPSGLFAATCTNGKWSVAPPQFGCAG